MPITLPYPTPTLRTVFASGLARAGEIAGFLANGIAPGLTIPTLSENARTVIERTAGSIPVFLDSGAFAEVTMGSTGPVVTDEISDEDWRGRLRVMQDMADALGSALTVVAPDQVGSQPVTLERLARYRAEVLALIATGARVLVPLQRGAMSLSNFSDAVTAIIGTAWVPAFPMKKAATALPDLLAYLRRHAPPSVHLLGCGVNGAGTRTLLLRAAAEAPTTELTMDSCLVTAAVGRQRSLRPYTAAQDTARAAVIGALEQDTDVDLWDVTLRYTDEIGRPSGWCGPSLRATVARDAGLSTRETVAFCADPDGFCAGECVDDDEDTSPLIDNPRFAMALDAAWAFVAELALTGPRLAVSSFNAFGQHATCGQFAPPAFIMDALRTAQCVMDVSAIPDTTPDREPALLELFAA